MNQEINNLGLVQSVKKPSDWIAGEYSPLDKKYLNLSGDWTAFLPTIEYQNASGFDRMSCVSYSLLNCLEILYLATNNVERNFSDRFLAKISGTTRQGNSLEAVFDAIRKFGLIDESIYPDDAKNWDEYYQDIPQEILNTAKEFLLNWDIYREWVNPFDKEALFNSLRFAPIQVTVRFANGNGLLNPDGVHNHAVCLFNAEYGKYWEIFDHYSQVKKKYDWKYNFGTALLPTLIKKTKPMFKPIDNTLYQLVQGIGGFALGLDGKLIVDDTAKIIASFMVRNQGDIKGRVKPLTQADWDSVEKINLKGEKI